MIGREAGIDYVSRNPERVLIKNKVPFGENASIQPVRLRSGQADWQLQDYVFAAMELPGTNPGSSSDSRRFYGLGRCVQVGRRLHSIYRGISSSLIEGAAARRR